MSNAYASKVAYDESANFDPVSLRYPPAQDNGERNRRTDKPAIGAHYDFIYKGVKLDPYRIFDVYGITNGPQQHAIKKLLRAGQSVKDLETDIREVVKSLNRWLEMMQEDAA